MTRWLLLLLCLLPALRLSAGNDPALPTKTVQAQRVQQKPVVDGIAEALWDQVPRAGDFLQLNPTEGLNPGQNTEVRFVYTNAALYVFANCYDTAPDSILTQLGERDDNLNADNFSIRLDTYDGKLDAYVFSVYASGVQEDFRFQDGTFNAVWNSAVQITDDGWTVEMEIPYSAIRFPAVPKQRWRMELTREIRRHREFDQWALTPKDSDNNINFWGYLEGIENIEAPVRLSLLPYVTLIGEHNNLDNPENPWNYRFAGGMDLKYGLNEAFTLDMTLLPDFSQVQSDNQIKNLGAFEVVFQEQRQFFQEGVELFSAGNLFYTRRIGGVPKRYFSAADEVQEGEELVDNPASAALMNASKISGRTSSGLGLGFFNAITRNTYATIRTADGGERKFLTDPLTNYNIAVVDKTLPNNSRAYLINTNVTRNGDWYDANVTAGGLTLTDKGNRWRLFGAGSHSILYGLEADETGNTNKRGTAYSASLERIKGRWRGGFDMDGISPDYDKRDMGVMFQTGVVDQGTWVGYNIYDPWWKLNNAWFNINFNTRSYWETGRLLESGFNPGIGATWRNFLTTWGGLEILLQDKIDYWEPRVADRYFREPRYTFGWMGFSSDYRKKLALDGEMAHGRAAAYGGSTYSRMYLEPIWRISDKFTVRHRATIEMERNDQGFSSFDTEDQPLFGSRDVTNWTQRFQAKYLFRNNLALSLRIRQFWSVGTYHQFYHLAPDGTLQERDWDQNQDFNFNAFNIDLVFQWQVAPGSFLRVVYKNSILDDATEIERHYLRNLERTLGLEQINNLSARLVWYLDYLDFRKQ